MSRLRCYSVFALAVVLGLLLNTPPAPGKFAPAPVNNGPGCIEVGIKGGGKMVMEFARIPRGKFMMGSPKDEACRQDNEALHEVEITKDYWLGKMHVTRGQFRAFVADTGYRTEAEKTGGAQTWNQKEIASLNWKSVGFAQTDGHPVVCVSWNDAKAFCDWLAKRSGRPTRLPTEAEWERACRAGAKTPYHFGGDQEDLRCYANVADASFRAATKTRWGMKGDDGHAFTAPGASYKANAWGLYDMHGNVWHWCADWYDENYYSISPKRDPAGPRAGHSRALRGGAWDCHPIICRAALRTSHAPSLRTDRFGFRVAFRQH